MFRSISLTNNISKKQKRKLWQNWKKRTESCPFQDLALYMGLSLLFLMRPFRHPLVTATDTFTPSQLTSYAPTAGGGRGRASSMEASHEGAHGGSVLGRSRAYTADQHPVGVPARSRSYSSERPDKTARVSQQIKGRSTDDMLKSQSYDSSSRAVTPPTIQKTGTAGSTKMAHGTSLDGTTNTGDSGCFWNTVRRLGVFERTGWETQKRNGLRRGFAKNF
eukprot:gb/GEZN01013593.1/.p1 GENE.gb/GEZN01013593.1/~~gb/GEZN01013593.1/.p1  ORF type:complete len:220 (-),score=15.88 gb/GEZN01013593.1/:16-675(-)